MSFVRRNDISDGYTWKCSTCARRKSVRDSSFFALSRLELHELIRVVNSWSLNQLQVDQQREANVHQYHTTVDWCNFCRDVCEEWIENHSQPIGSFDENFEPKTVEIDESYFFRRKYNRGAWRPGHWVFGGIERGSGRCFLAEVPDRTKNTLQDAIKRFILPGTHIISDGWAAYGDIDEIDGGVYSHDTIVHEDHFVDPEQPEVHTQNIENLWMRTKKKLKRMHGTSRLLFSTYLHEFMWRCNFRAQDGFSSFLTCVAQQYPL